MGNNIRIEERIRQQREDAERHNPLDIVRRANGADGPIAGGHWPAAIDLAKLSRTEPPPPEFLIEDWLPVGYATLLAGHGGVGKSAIALHLAVCMAAGVPFFGLPVKRQRVGYLSCEDREDTLHWRLARICAYVGADLAELAGWLVVKDLVGHDTLLWTPGYMVDRQLTIAALELRQMVEMHSLTTVFIDGLSDVFAGSENDRAQAKDCVNLLLSIVQTPVLVGHVNKMSASGQTTGEGYSGSTGWHNAVRARWYLYPETDDDEDGGRENTGTLALELQKSNLGKTQQSMRFKWDDEAHLFVGEQVMTQHARASRDADERDGIMAALRAVTESGDYCPASDRGERSAFNVLRIQPIFPESLRPARRANRRRFWGHIEELRRLGQLREGQRQRSNRHLVATLEPESQA